MLPLGTISFGSGSRSVSSDESGSYFPLVMFVVMALATSAGVAAVPWMFISELFPFK